MSILEVKNLQFKYTDQELFNNSSFRLLKNDHMGLVGLNGVGKTTFMNIIAKNIKPDNGSVEWLSNLKVGYMDQHMRLNNHLTILDYLYDVYCDLFNLEKQMEELYSKASLDEKYLYQATQIQDELIEKDFYAFKSRIGNIISGLGIDISRVNEPLSKLSGGQRAKVIFGKLLLEEPDVLLMDEPTNFLDVNHIDWLTKYLNAYPKAFIVISHDTYFINNVSNVICALENKEIFRYKGNYDFYLKEREIRITHHEKNYLNQQKLIKDTKEFIAKNITRATTSTRAKSRVKMLDKLEIITKPEGNKKIQFTFPFSKNLGPIPLKVVDLVVGYENKAILPKLNFEIKNNQKIVITGHNGIGKTTIIKTLMGIIKPISGSFKFAENVDLLYFSQENEADLNQLTFNIIKQDYPEKEDKEIRAIFSKTGIDAKLVMKKFKELSGGEQARAKLARLSMQKANFLVFDEPTNHLDIDSKKALMDAINKFNGVVIIVSHEKEFYNLIANLEINLDSMV